MNRLQEALATMMVAARQALGTLDDATTVAVATVTAFVAAGIRAGIIVPEDKASRTYFHHVDENGINVPLGVALGTYDPEAKRGNGAHTTMLAAAHAGRALVHAGARGVASITADTAADVLDNAGIPTSTSVLRSSPVTDALKAYARGDDTSVGALRSTMAAVTDTSTGARPEGNATLTAWERFAHDMATQRERFDTLAADGMTLADVDAADTAADHADYVSAGIRAIATDVADAA